MKKTTLVIALVAVGVIVLIAALGFYRFNFTNGGDQVLACTEEAKICPDGSAVGRQGPKCEFAPCPKTSPIYDKTKEDIQAFFIAKYPKYAKTLSVGITKEAPKHVRGQVSFENGMGGGIFFAVKIETEWQIVHEGNGAIPCTLSTYGFPADMLSDCVK